MAGLRAVRDAWRALRRNAAMALPVSLVLALAIGANALAWSLLDSVLLRRLPYARPDRLAMVWSSTAEAPTDVVSWPDFLDWQRQSRSFESMTAFHATEEQLAGGDEPEVVEGAAVSPEFFAVLGIRPAAGRFFLAGDATKSAADVVVLSERLWRRRFGASRAVLGRVIHLSGVPVQVVGIAPAGFRQPDPLDGKDRVERDRAALGGAIPGEQRRRGRPGRRPPSPADRRSPPGPADGSRRHGRSPPRGLCQCGQSAAGQPAAQGKGFRAAHGARRDPWRAGAADPARGRPSSITSTLGQGTLWSTGAYASGKLVHVDPKN